MTEKEKRGIWQYLIDHSRLQKNGYLGVVLYFWDEEDFWRRVEFRINGTFKRYEVESREAMIKKAQAYRIAVKINNERTAKIAKIVNDIKRKGSLKKRIVLKIYHFSRAQLFNNL